MESTQIKEIIAKSWDQKHGSYDDTPAHGLKSDGEKREWLRFLDDLIVQKPSYCLDVGAGTGFISLLLCELGHVCRGIDLSEGMLEEAKEKAKKMAFSHICFEIGDAENIDSLDETYDVVINRHLLWTLPDPEKAVNEWLRVTKMGGMVIIIDGDWFDETFSKQLRQKTGRVLAKITGKSREHKEIYSAEVIENLPMMKGKETMKTLDLLKKTGYKLDIKDMKRVENAEREAMTLAERLLYSTNRCVIIVHKE